MSGTRHKQVRAAVAAVLAAGAGLPAGDVIEGRRTRPMPEQTQRQIHVYLDFAKPTRGQAGGIPDDWKTRIRIECSARASAAMTGEDRADELAATCYGLVAAEPSLGGLCMDMEPLGLAWDTEEAELTMGVTQVLFDAMHRTPSTSIAAP